MNDAERLAGLQAEHPGWRLWRARTSAGEAGMWMATRRRHLTTEEMFIGLAPTLAEDSADRLRDALSTQARLDAQARKVR
jgi:hypothetical protein